MQPIYPDYADYDSPWKDMLERYFPECMEFFFPDVYAGIDWSCGYDFLDKELQQVVRDAEFGRRLVDKLVKVYDKNGAKERWVLVHIEVQGVFDEPFAKRMYIYNYRLFDRYGFAVCSLAILSDEREEWRPSEFSYELWGSKVRLEFPVVKLLDYRGREQELENHPNLFALIVLAFLKSKETRKNADSRFEWKFRLFRLLYERGLSRDDILELTRFLDWIMILPEELAQRFDEVVNEYEEAQQMRYITSFEWHGMEKGLQQGRQEGIQQGIQQGLQQGLQQGIERGLQQGSLLVLQQFRDTLLDLLTIRFQQIPLALLRQLENIDNASALKILSTKAFTSSSLEEFEQEVEKLLAK